MSGQSTIEATGSDTAASDDAGQVLQAFFAAFGAGDLQAVLDLMDQDVTVVVQGAAHVPWAGEWRGRDGAEKFLGIITSVVEPRAFAVDDIVASGARAVAFGSHSFLVSATGKVFSGDFALRIDVADGHIVRYSIYEHSYVIAEAFA